MGGWGGFFFLADTMMPTCLLACLLVCVNESDESDRSGESMFEAGYRI